MLFLLHCHCFIFQALSKPHQLVLHIITGLTICRDLFIVKVSFDLVPILKEISYLIHSICSNLFDQICKLLIVCSGIAPGMEIDLGGELSEEPVKVLELGVHFGDS